jgi:hypothetical protein
MAADAESPEMAERLKNLSEMNLAFSMCREKLLLLRATLASHAIS